MLGVRGIICSEVMMNGPRSLILLFFIYCYHLYILQTGQAPSLHLHGGGHSRAVEDAEPLVHGDVSIAIFVCLKKILPQLDIFFIISFTGT